jgi:hypothetical protein
MAISSFGLSTLGENELTLSTVFVAHRETRTGISPQRVQIEIENVTSAGIRLAQKHPRGKVVRKPQGHRPILIEIGVKRMWRIQREHLMRENNFKLSRLLRRAGANVSESESVVSLTVACAASNKK